MGGEADPAAIDVAVNQVEELAKTTGHLVTIVKNVEEILSKTSVSAKVEVLNTTSQALTLTWNDDGHSWGGFAPPPTQPVLAPYSKEVFGSASGGGSSGTTGSVFYAMPGGTVWHVRWDVPVMPGSSNVAQASLSGPGAEMYFSSVLPAGAGKKAAQMRYILTERALTDGNQEGDWRYCDLCGSLFHSLRPGRCPGAPPDPGPPIDEVVAKARLSPQISDFVPSDASLYRAGATITEQMTKPAPRNKGVKKAKKQYGPHTEMGHTFQLGHTTAGPSRERGWTRCRNCKVVFYDAWDESKGICPDMTKAAHGHIAEDVGLEYWLQMNIPPRPDQQTDWRFCTKCLGLFYLPHKHDSRCPAGELHEAGADRYVLTRVPNTP